MVDWCRLFCSGWIDAWRVNFLWCYLMSILKVYRIADDHIQVLGQMGLRETIEIRYSPPACFDQGSKTWFIETEVTTDKVQYIKAL